MGRLTPDLKYALRQKYNPEGSALRRDQMELLELLKVIAGICSENGIQWWLSSGTLLGAARHEGFIPWDDDIDIVMLREDYRKLEKILCSMQSDEYVFHCMKTDVEYVNVFGKFRKRSGYVSSKNRRQKFYRYTGVGIDIFAIEKTSWLAARAAKSLYNFQRITGIIGAGWIRRPLIRLIEVVDLCILFPLLRLIGKINPRNEYHYVLGTGWPDHTFFMEDALPLGTAQFEGCTFPVPKDMDAYLTKVYGDWRTIPSDDFIRKMIHCQDYIDEIYGITE